MEPQEKLRQDVDHFLEVYRVLSPEGKAQFEAQMNGELKGKDEPSRRLYQALQQAARDGLETEAAIEMMEQAAGVSLP